MTTNKRKKPSGNRLVGFWLYLARGFYIVTVGLTIAMLIAAGVSESRYYMYEAAFRFLPSLNRIGSSVGFYAGYRTFLDNILAFGFVIVGIILFLRKSNDWMVMLVSLGTITFGALFVPSPIYLVGDLPGWRIPVDLIRTLGLVLSLISFFYLFPDGKFVPSWTIIPGIIWAIAGVIWLLDPKAPANLIQLTTWGDDLRLSILILLGAYISGFASQVYRYRYVSDQAQRQQTKWVVFGVSTALLGFILYYLPSIALPGAFGQPGIPRLMQIYFGIPVYHLMMLMAPVSIGVSTLRYKLWDIDRLINKGLIYSLLTMALLLVFFLSGAVFSSIFYSIIGLPESQLGTIVSTLIIAVLFNPLRQSIQETIDKRFNRKRYNAERSLEALRLFLQNEVDFNIINTRLVSMVKETMQPEKVILLFADSRPETENKTQPGLMRLESIPEVSQVDAITISPDDPAVSYFAHLPDIQELDRIDLESPILQSLREQHIRLVAPLVNQGKFIGILGLGPHLSEQDYSTDDLKFLAKLVSQATPALQLASLAQQQQIEAIEKERIKYELDVARMIQKTFLPKEFPVLPDWTLAAHYQPARAVGGDFYDLVNLSDHRLAIVIGDVADHGIPAALIMATTLSILRGAVRRLSSPAKVLERVNDILHEEIPSPMYVTCFYAVLDLQCGELVYANAGHNLPFWRLDGKVDELYATGMPLGLMPGSQYEEKSTVIAPSESVLFFTDGLIEARNKRKEMFGKDHILAILATQEETGSAFIHTLLSELDSFIGSGFEQEDDVTLLSLGRDGHAVFC